MIYSFDLHLVDLLGWVLAIFVLGMMAGHKFLPKPIDIDKERLIDGLFKENMCMKLQGLKPKPENEIRNDRNLHLPVKGKSDAAM